MRSAFCPLSNVALASKESEPSRFEKSLLYDPVELQTTVSRTTAFIGGPNH